MNTLAQLLAAQAQPQQPFAYRPPEPDLPIARIPERNAAPFYGLPAVDDLLPLDAAANAASYGAADAAPTFADVTRPYDSFMPGYRESANVEDRRGNPEDDAYSWELDRLWRQSSAGQQSSVAPLMSNALQRR